MIKFKRFFKASFPRGFSSFKSNRKLIELAKTFEKYDINSYFLPNNDEHNVFPFEKPNLSSFFHLKE